MEARLKATTRIRDLKAAIYTRVSTTGKGQTTENQTPALEDFCRTRGWEIVSRYDEAETASGSRERKQFTQMMEDAHRGRFQVLVFWSLDRFSREGTFATLNELRRLDAAGVRYISVTEQWLDSMGVFRDAIIGMLAAVAKMERDRLSERVKAGLDRARKKGQRLGRKPAEISDEALEKALEAGWSYREMSQAFRVGRATLSRRVKKLNREEDRREAAPDVPLE